VEQVVNTDRDRRVNALVQDLPEQERSVIKLRFGLTGDEPRTLRQTGIELGITTEQARQLEAKGLERLADSPELDALRSAA
jgi:RNA polymerase primary sigma factor